MDYLVQMKKISDYYKGRYEKAVSLGISENSRHYEAFKEIERRYTATELASECMETLKKYQDASDYEKNVHGSIRMIVEILALQDTIMNDEGEIDYIPRRIRLSKDDRVAVEALHRGHIALNCLKNLDYENSDRENIYHDTMRCFYDIVDWMLIARDMVYHVGRRN